MSSPQGSAWPLMRRYDRLSIEHSRDCPSIAGMHAAVAAAGSVVPNRGVEFGMWHSVRRRSTTIKNEHVERLTHRVSRSYEPQSYRSRRLTAMRYAMYGKSERLSKQVTT